MPRGAAVNEPDDEPEFDTLDEAIAYALADVGPGGVVTIHDEKCESEDGEEGCTCEPMVLAVGAEA